MANDNKSLELQIRIATQESLETVLSLKGEIEALAGEAKKFSESEGQAIAATFRNMEAAAEKASTSMKLFGSSSAELRQVQAQLKNAAVELVNKGIDPQSAEIKKLVEEYKRLGNEAAAIDKANGSNIDSFGKLKNSIMNLAEVAATLKALSVIKDMGAFALQTADNFQTARNQFGILLGDMEAGAGLFNEIKAFNDVTPFDLDTLTQATNVLIAAKVPLKDLQDQLTKFGDLSQGNSQRMTSYVNAFSQAAAKGKADMQVLNTYLHQGVPILDALAKNFNVTTAEIVQMSSDGKISFADFSKALDDLTAAGGRYFGGMELASKSLAAMQEGLNEAVNSLAASFGDILLPAATDIIGALTEITNAIDESPLVKGLLAGALVAVSGYMTVMAVKAGIAFARQMALNLAVGAMNPVVLASTIAVAGLAAAYVAQASIQQKAAKDADNFALSLKKQSNALNDAAGAARGYAEAFSNMSGEKIAEKMKAATDEVMSLTGRIGRKQQELNNLTERYLEEGRDFMLYNNPEIEKLELDIGRLNLLLGAARAELKAAQEGYQQYRRGTADETPIDDKAKKAAEKWLEQWREQYERFKAEISGNPFALLNMEYKIKIDEANSFGADRTIINQINEYYAAERSKIIKDLKDEEERLAVSLTKTKIDDIEYQKRKELEALAELEQKRILSALYTGEEIAKIQERFAQMREDIDFKFSVEIDKAKLDEARDAVKNWQEELSDNLLSAVMNLQIFSDQASAILSELATQLIELSSSAALSGFEEFGRALGEGEKGMESLSRALAAMAEQILKQLPMMFLQAGLQLIANGQWPLGLGFIAAAGSSAIIAGYVDGAPKHAQGGVFDEYGKAARAFASGGTFTNQIVNEPTYFKYGGSLGVMGEAGPEAIMPLTRMPNGSLGVQTAGGAANVTVNVINNSGAEVRQEESEGADGGRQIDVIIGGMVNKHIASGKADRIMSGRYGQRALGV